MSTMHGFICSTPVYEFEDVRFEYSQWLGPCPLKKDGDPKKRTGKKFWGLFERFLALPDEEQMRYRIGGGCERF